MCQAFCDWRAGMYGWSDEPYQDQLARSLAKVERAVELDPRDSDEHYVLGLVALHHCQLLRAEEALQQCLRLASSYAPAHGLLGLVRTRRGFPAEAAAHCDRAFAMSPHEPLRAIWHAAKALAALELGDDQGAFEEAQRGIAVNPAYSTSRAQQRPSAWAPWRRPATGSRCCAGAPRSSAWRLFASGWRAHEPAALGQFERLIELLRDAGLPAD